VNPTAYHEAGHVVMARILGRKLLRTTIEPGDDWPAKTELDDTIEPDIGTEKWDQWNEEELLMKCAGAVAEARCLRCQCDSKYKLIAHQGDSPLALATRRYPDARERDKYLDRMLDQTKRRIESHWAEVELVAAALEKRRSLDGADVDTVLRSHENRSV
jgi:hypothetical protein